MIAKKLDMNLNVLWNKALAEDINHGVAAYATYQKVIRRYADLYGFGIVPAVEAFAALSPNNDYHGNLRSLASCMKGVREGKTADQITVTTYRSCADRAMSYLKGEVSFPDTVKGLKITAFRHNLLYPSTSREVTVDGHMIAAGLDKKLNMKEAQMELRKTHRMYYEIADAVRRLARRHKLVPCHVQATLWYTRKRLLKIVYPDQADLFWEDGVNMDVRPEDYPAYDDPCN